MRRIWRWLLAVTLLSAFLTPAVASLTLENAAAANTAGGLSVFVGYAEDKEIETPNAAQFPTPWAGAPNTAFLGGTVPGQAACGSLPTCYDTGAIRLDNSGTSPVTVGDVSVDDHSSLPGGKVFDLWGSFSVPPGQSVILAANPPNNNPSFDNFDTSGFPATCTPLTVAPTVTITVGGVPTTLVDSTHVLDTGGIDRGSCSPQRNESIQWRPIGSSGSDAATLSLGPATASAFQGNQVSETATLLDGAGTGLPNSTVAFSVLSGPDAGQTGTAVTNGNGVATFTYTGSGQGEDVVQASVTTVGSFVSNTTEVLWVDGSSAGWSSADIGSPTPAGSQSFNSANGTWTVAGGGTDINGTSDQFHYVWQALPGDGGVAAAVTSQTAANPAAKAGVMLRASTDPASPYYAAFVTPGSGVVVQERSAQGGATTTLLASPGTVPAFLWVAVSGGKAATYGSTDGFTWSPMAGSEATPALGPAPLAGLAVTSHNTGALSTATMDPVVLTNAAPAPLPPVSCPSNWTCGDIGSPTPAGNQSYAPTTGTWTIEGGGADITGTSDQFHYVWQSLTGNGGLSARVASQTVASSQAKAGIMLRATTDPGSPNYAVVVTPGAGIKVQVRSTQGGTTTKIANPTGTVPTYLEVTWSGSTFTASTSADGVTWTPIPGSTATVSLGSTFLAGLAVTSHNTGALSTVTMDNVTTQAASSPPPPCPSNWTCGDIGSPTPAGNQSYAPTTGTWTIEGGGADITGTSDQFHYVWQSLTGNGGLSARVASQTVASSQAKAGIMLRATTDPGSPNYAVVVTPGAGIKVQVRSTQGGTTTKIANPTGTVPTYLEVTWSGSTFTASTSADGVTWTPIPGSTATVSLGSTFLAGLAVTSHNTGALSTVTMDNVTTQAASSPPPPCPSNWTCGDIGSPTPAGNQSYAPTTGTWTIEGGGADITGTSDQFHYVWQSLTGNGGLSARVASQTVASSQAKAGIMLRATTDPGSPNYAVVVTPGAGIKVQVRSTQGGTTTKIANPTGTVPTYLEVTWSGSTFTASTSADGVTWTPIPGSTATVSLGSTFLAGLAVTSHNTGALSTVTMDNVTMS